MGSIIICSGVILCGLIDVIVEKKIRIFPYWLIYFAIGCVCGMITIFIIKITGGE